MEIRGRMFSLLITTLLLYGTSTGNIISQDKSMCDVPSVREGQPTMLTCQFSEDFNYLQRNVKIVHYSPNGEKFVVLCDMSSGKPNCQTEPGYSIAGNTNRTLFVLIPHASEDHTGKYSCQLFNSATNSYELCSFSLRHVETTCDIPAVQVGQTTELTCQFNEDMSIRQKNIKVTHYLQEKEEIVALCHWVSGTPSCQMKHDFVFSGVINDRLVIILPLTEREHAGDYTCSVYNSSDDNDETCTLTLLDSPGVTSAPAISLLEGVVSENPEDISQYHFIIIIAASVSVLLIVLVAVIAAVCIRRSHRRSDGNVPEVSDSDQYTLFKEAVDVTGSTTLLLPTEKPSRI